MMGVRNFSLGAVVSLAMLSGCGVTKELLPEKPPGSLPEMPAHEKPLEDPSHHALKRIELEITHSAEPLKTNEMIMKEGAEKYAQVYQRFDLPIQFNGWIMLDSVSQNFENCAAQVTVPTLYLGDDLKGQPLVLLPKQKMKVIVQKRYHINVVFNNDAQCTGVNVRFGVLYGE